MSVTTYKWVYWSNNPIGEMLARMLQQLPAAGILVYREEPDQQYGWNLDLRTGWENNRSSPSPPATRLL